MRREKGLREKNLAHGSVTGKAFQVRRDGEVSSAICH